MTVFPAKTSGRAEVEVATGATKATAGSVAIALALASHRHLLPTAA
jgi:hypothetical protein